MKRRWPFWRKLMLAGALWLLVIAVATPGLDAPGAVAALGYAIGYGTLMTGFYFAMKERRPTDPTEPSDDLMDEDVTR